MEPYVSWLRVFTALTQVQLSWQTISFSCQNSVLFFETLQITWSAHVSLKACMIFLEGSNTCCTVSGLRISFPLFLICSNSLFHRNRDNSENWKSLKNWNVRIQKSYLKWYGASDNSSMIGVSCLAHLKIIFFINDMGNQDHPQEKEMQKGKVIVWGGLTNSYEKKRSKRQSRKGKIYPFECRIPKNSKER